MVDGRQLPRLVIFDCDGTLVDSQMIICAAMERAFAQTGLAYPGREATLSIVGLSLPEAFRRLAPDASESVAASLIAAYKGAFFDLRQDAAYHEPMFPGARAALDVLSAEPATMIAMATGKSRRGVEAVVARHGLGGLFHSWHTADDGPSKPHPHMILAAVEAAGVASHRAAMIGDTTFDMQMAVAAGAIPIGVDWGYHPADALWEAGAVAVLTHFDDLGEALEAAMPA